MAGTEGIGGDGLTSSLAGMSKTQLYDIMSQMKTLIEQNQQQARQILIQNPLLTRALFQAQIMLGMVHTPQAIPNIQPTVSQPPTQSMQPTQPTNTQAPQSLPKQSDLRDHTSASQTSNPLRKQHQSPPMVPPPSTSAPPMNLPPPPLPSHPLHPKNTANSAQAPQMSLPQSSQLHHSIPHPIQPPMPMSSSQLQQPLPSHMMMQPPLPPQPRPPSMPTFSHQPQMGPNTGFQHPGAPQLHHSQPMFHPGMKAPVMGSSFPQGQPPRPSQLPSHPMYQVGNPHLNTEFGNPHLNTEFGNQLGSSLQPERGGGSTWMPGLSDNSMVAPPQPPLPSLGPSSQMGQPNQPPRPAPLTPEMEQALLQQVMSLTQEQINLLPPEQRNQVLQLQQMLRQ